MKLYITYKDDGPAGVCGQTVDITNPRSKLYVISGDTEERIKNELRNLQESVNNLRATRRNARLTDYYWEGNEWEKDDVKYISTESSLNSFEKDEVVALAQWLSEQSLIYRDFLQSRSGSNKLSRVAELLLESHSLLDYLESRLQKSISPSTNP